MIRRLGMALVLASLQLTSALAEPLGTGFVYQGQLTLSGTPVTDACDCQFGLWDSPAGGSQVGATQTLGLVQVSNGIFSVELNGGGEFGASPFGTAEGRWLEIAVRCPGGSGNYTTLSPRQKVTATPYAIATLSIVDGAISTTKLADLAVTAPKLADLAVTAPKLAAEAVGEVAIAPAAVTTAKLADNAVTGVKLADNTVTGVKLADNSVTSTKLADLSVTATKLDAGSVTVTAIADLAVSTAKLAVEAVTAPKLAAEAVLEAAIAPGAVTTFKLADDAVTGVKLASNTVTGAKLVDNSVTSLKLADQAVTATKLGVNSVTVSAIADLAVSTAKLAAEAVTAPKLAVEAVSEVAIAPGAVTTLKLADQAVTATKLGVSSVTTTAIADLAVTTFKIQSNAVTSDKINIDGGSLSRVSGAVMTSSGGMIGIGTTQAPTEKLEVNGAIKITGDTRVISRAPRVIHSADPSTGCPPTRPAGTDLITQSFSLARSADVQVTATMVRNFSGLAELQLYVDGLIVARTFTQTATLQWEAAEVVWGATLAAGNHLISVRSPVANVWGCGADAGSINTVIFE